ncbi:MAG TPA: hypothetical protein VFO21_12930 [Vicinamibacterales bacterium]|nr:hypothetical protein [Vicinamibacterales bacterium]
MITQRLLLGTVVGAVVFTLLGYLAYGIVFADFFANNGGSATGVQRDPFDFVSLVAGQVVFGALLTMILIWASAANVMQGVKIAFVTGLLFFLAIDLTMYATTNIQNLTASLVDPVIGGFLFAFAGAAIMAVTKGKK